MAIKKSNASAYTTIPQEYKDKLARVAVYNHRSLSGEIAHAIALYLLNYDDEGKPLLRQRGGPPSDIPY
jgi:hypothetical protein